MRYFVLLLLAVVLTGCAAEGAAVVNEAGAAGMAVGTAGAWSEVPLVIWVLAVAGALAIVLMVLVMVVALGGLLEYFCYASHAPGPSAREGSGNPTAGD